MRALFLIGFSWVAQWAVAADITLIAYFEKSAPSIKIQNAISEELNLIFRPSGLRLRLVGMPRPQEELEPDTAVHVFLRGRCQPQLLRSAAQVSTEPLAATSYVDGQMRPVMHVFCDHLSAFLAGYIRPSEREQQYGRAIARVTAHELYHFITGSTNHDHHSQVFRFGLRARTLVEDAVLFTPLETQTVRSKARLL